MEDEQKDAVGQLWLRLSRTHSIVIGKYAEPLQDGTQFYVTNKPDGVFGRGTVTRHDHLLTAVSKIAELIEEFENADLQDRTPGGLPG